MGSFRIHGSAVLAARYSLYERSRKSCPRRLPSSRRHTGIGAAIPEARAMRCGHLAAVCAASVACIGPVHAQTSLPPETMVPAALRAPDIDPAIARAIARISAERLRAIDSRLVAFGTRSTFSERAGSRRGVLAARTWIAEAFRSIAQHSNGRMTVALDSYVQCADALA
jgi:hypothetical protein